MNELTYEEFKKKYIDTKEKSNKWRFDLFKIVCIKCGSDHVEFNSDICYSCGWYAGEGSIDGSIIVKCHACGNAFKIDHYNLDED